MLEPCAGKLARTVLRRRESGDGFLLSGSSEFVEVPTKQVKPSQTCPDCGAKKKKSLAERWHSCECGCEKPRDVASAQVNLNWALGIQAGNQPKKAA